MQRGGSPLGTWGVWGKLFEAFFFERLGGTRAPSTGTAQGAGRGAGPSRGSRAG